MKAATITQIKEELNQKSQMQLVDISLKLARFKKENKELLTYLLFEAANELEYVMHIKEEIDDQWNMVNTRSLYFINKSIRKILRSIKKFIRYSKKKETEVELLFYFCKKLNSYNPYIIRSSTLRNILYRELVNVKKKVAILHEDLQYDYEQAIELEFR